MRKDIFCRCTADANRINSYCRRKKSLILRAATVLVKKKNISSSQDTSDQYCLCTDYRALNSDLPSSGWPAPSLDECLDAANGSLHTSVPFILIPDTTRFHVLNEPRKLWHSLLATVSNNSHGV